MQITQEQLSVTLLVKSRFLSLLGALRARVDFRDPTAVFRFNTAMDKSGRELNSCVAEFNSPR